MDIKASWSIKDNCYISNSPSFPLLIGFGDTQEDAIHSLQTKIIGIDVWMNDAGEIVY